MRRPTKAKPSADYLTQRRVEEILVKQGDYRAAHDVAKAAARLYEADYQATQAAHEAAWALKISKIAARHQAELDVLLQRAGQGRDELELRRLDEGGRRAARFRAMAAELQSAHRLEVAHLEHWCMGQVSAGRYDPLRDPASRQRREALMLEQLRD